MIVVLAGGTGGAKLARGIAEAEGPDSLTVIANTGDDVDVYGVHVSPDPDLITYRLAGILDEQRGFGVEGDTREVMTALERAGGSAWFDLGDRDLATCLLRTEMLAAGERLTTAAVRIARGLGVRARVLPMSDDPVRTHVLSAGRRIPFQEFMVRHRTAPAIEGVELARAEDARPTPEVLAAVAGAEAIVIGPSNPVISVGPILALAGMREALRAAQAPVVAVSPFVRGRAVKGPTEAFCRHAGLGVGARAALEAYRGLLDGVVADEPLDDPEVRSLEVDTRMDRSGAARSLAAVTLEFARKLAR
ncbi:MAG TPA: 2-phospho-L-lactate transferase [Thermoleophilaceae bacterium]|nr:2-phospho-L-lactate transferase [Thermoleophilaceae bacterium]